MSTSPTHSDPLPTASMNIKPGERFPSGPSGPQPGQLFQHPSFPQRSASNPQGPGPSMGGIGRGRPPPGRAPTAPPGPAMDHVSLGFGSGSPYPSMPHQQPPQQQTYSQPQSQSQSPYPPMNRPSPAMQRPIHMQNGSPYPAPPAHSQSFSQPQSQPHPHHPPYPHQRSITSPISTQHPSQPFPTPQGGGSGPPYPHNSAPVPSTSRISSLSSHSSQSGHTHSRNTSASHSRPPPMPVGPIIPPEPNVARRRPSVREGEDERGVNGVNEGGRDRDSGGSGNGERAIGTGMADQDGGAGGGGSRSPLGDLLEGENVYVERLGLIIRRVAAAWSRQNLPPPSLDKMFRAIEGVFKVNKAFVVRLEEIQANPISPKVLGDLLIQWIDDLYAPYERYSNNLYINFDSHPAITDNPALAKILADLSQTNPPPSQSSSPTSSQGHIKTWTVDIFFTLPYDRLQHYRKLYARLLSSTKEGKSDHKLLRRSCERLDTLDEVLENRLGMDVNVLEGRITPSESMRRPKKVSEGGPVDEKGRESTASSTAEGSSVDAHILSPFTSNNTGRGSGESAISSIQEEKAQEVVVSPTARTAKQGEITPVERSGSPPLTDLEVRLDTSKAIDLFTMKSKQCRLQIAPPTLSFRREQRYNSDVEIFFTPKCTGNEVAHQRGHIFILSDLFLMCEHMTAMEKASKAQNILVKHPERAGDGSPFPEMWLCYPPLAGRHLSVDTGGLETELVVTVMGRETFLLVFESRGLRAEAFEQLRDCIDFATKAAKPSVPHSAPVSPQPERQRQPDADRSISVHSLDSALPTIPQKVSMPQPRIAPPDPQMSAPPPRNASLRSPIDQRPPPMPFPGNYPPPHMPQPMMSGSIDPRNHIANFSPHQGLNSAPPPRSAPLMAQNGYPLPGHAQPSRSHDGHTRLPEPYPPYHQPMPPMHHQQVHRAKSTEGLRVAPRINIPPNLPSPMIRGGYDEDDEISPVSPADEQIPQNTGPAVISAQMKCKVFLKQSHQQWKSLGAARLKLYVQTSTNVKQLVVESDNRDKTMLISTIVLTDGVERVAKTGVAIEISDVSGARTGIIYMIQLRNEDSAGGLFDSLIAGSDRAVSGSTYTARRNR